MARSFQTNIQGGEGLKVLLVDKDPNSLEYMSRVLEEHSYRVTTTKLAIIGLSMILESGMQFDLIICEIDMPGMDGFEFMKHIIFKADICTLLISASEDVEVTRKVLKEGVCFFFQKPITQHNLVNMWQYVLRYRLQKNQLMNGLIRREVEKYYESFHGMGKSSFLGKLNFSNSIEMGKNPEIIGSSTAFETQASSNNEYGNYIGENIQLGKRARESDGIISSSSSASSPLGGKNKDQEKKKEKAPRLFWTPELQKTFKTAYEALGELRATPLKILDLMNEPGITPQHISSYLQKFRSKIKIQNEEATKPVETPHHFPVYEFIPDLGTYPTSLRSDGPPYDLNLQLNIPKPTSYNFQTHGNLMPQMSIPKPTSYNFQTHGNLMPQMSLNHHNIQTSGYLMQNDNLSNFRGNTSNIVSSIFCQRIHQNIVPGLYPLEPISATGIFQNNLGLCTFMPERNPHVPMPELNCGLGMAGVNIGASVSVLGGNGITQVQEQNGGLGKLRNIIRISPELSPEEIDNILQHISKEDSNIYGGSSLAGNPSSSSITQPLTPHIGTTIGGEEVTDGDAVEEDMERFLNMEEYPTNSDGEDNVIIP